MIIISNHSFSLFKKKINKQGQARGIKTVPQTVRCVAAFSARFMNIQGKKMNKGFTMLNQLYRASYHLINHINNFKVSMSIISKRGE